MAGVLVPFVLLPRYSCYSGADDFTTNPIDLSAYAAVIMNAWRAPLVHGLLHLLGYEHGADMEARERVHLG